MIDDVFAGSSVEQTLHLMTQLLVAAALLIQKRATLARLSFRSCMV